jgi:hypothetical protein
VNIIATTAHDDGIKQTSILVVVLLEHLFPNLLLIELFPDEISLHPRAIDERLARKRQSLVPHRAYRAYRVPARRETSRSRKVIIHRRHHHLSLSLSLARATTTTNALEPRGSTHHDAMNAMLARDASL